MSDIRNNEEFAKRFEAMAQPAPDQPKISVALQWSELTPFEKAAFAAKMGMPEVAQMEMQAGTEPAHIVKAKTDLAKEQMKGQGEAGKAEAEQARTQADLVKTAVSLEHDKQKHQMDLTKTAVDIHQSREKHRMDLEKKAADIEHIRAKGAAGNGS